MKATRLKIRRQVFMYLHYFIQMKKSLFFSKEKDKKTFHFEKENVKEGGNGFRYLLLQSVMLLCSLFFAFNVKAQSNQLGVRLGNYSGFTFRHFNANDVGVEVNLLKWVPYRGASLSVLAEKNWQLKNGFSLYAGGGLFAGSYRNAYYYRRKDGFYRYEFSGTYWGLEGVLGGDYKFENAPIMLGLDLRPRFVNFAYPYPWDAGLNVRYVF